MFREDKRAPPVGGIAVRGQLAHDAELRCRPPFPSLVVWERKAAAGHTLDAYWVVDRKDQDPS